MASKGLVIDSSAFVAYVRREPAASAVGDVVQHTDFIFMSASTRLESSMVLASQADFTEGDMLRALSDMGITIVPFTDAHAKCGLEAFQKFGKGRHKAALNFGDCHAYATAKLAGLPLLFIGKDFSLTDIESVL